MVNKIKQETENLSGKVFRPQLVFDAIANLPKEPGFIYKGVAMNIRQLPYNVEDHEKAGYEIVYTKEQVKDERAFSPDSNLSDSTVLSPVLKTTADGVRYIVMRISEENFEKLMKRRHEEDIKRHPGQVYIKDKMGVFKSHSDVNINK